MYPTHFAELLKGWLADAQHPGVAQVRTCADIGWHEQPVGVAVTLGDGWTFLLQCVGAYPAGGSANENPNTPRPERFGGDWADRDDYRQARKAFTAEQAAYRGAKPNKPQASAAAIVAWVGLAIEAQQHPELVSVTAGDRGTLRILCDDQSTINALPAGYIAPGATDLAHPAHQTPKEWTR